jgi:hypothetical protein
MLLFNVYLGLALVTTTAAWRARRAERRSR